MAALTVFKFSDPTGAQQTIDVLEGMRQEELIRIQDYAIVSWPEGAKKPKTTQAVNTKGVGALDGAFWGMLFGLIFFVPLLGAALGAGIGALSGMFADVGIDDRFIKRVKAEVTEGTSALFLLSEGAVIDRVSEGTRQLPPHELIASNLTSDQEARLREMFA
ncbi:MAG TPA: DUF1269 domain-containing protein [Thermomicrobiales bacterium]|nr:DUF1269 domain-containing protein [Thermomicrobiales bacterium]